MENRLVNWLKTRFDPIRSEYGCYKQQIDQIIIRQRFDILWSRYVHIWSHKDPILTTYKYISIIYIYKLNMIIHNQNI